MPKPKPFKWRQKCRIGPIRTQAALPTYERRVGYDRNRIEEILAVVTVGGVPSAVEIERDRIERTPPKR